MLFPFGGAVKPRQPKKNVRILICNISKYYVFYLTPNLCCLYVCHKKLINYLLKALDVA